MADAYWDSIAKKYAGKNSLDGGAVPLRRWMDPPLPDQSPRDGTEPRPHRTRYNGTSKKKK